MDKQMGEWVGGRGAVSLSPSVAILSQEGHSENSYHLTLFAQLCIGSYKGFKAVTIGSTISKQNNMKTLSARVQFGKQKAENLFHRPWKYWEANRGEKSSPEIGNSRNPLPRPGRREERRAQCYQIQEAESFSGSWDHSGIHQWEVVTEEMQPVTKRVGLFLLS